MRCGLLATAASGLPMTRKLDEATCDTCLRRRKPLGGSRRDPLVSAAAEYVARTTLVGGVRREVLPCECGALMIAGIDHTCDPDDRLDGGLSWS